MQSIFDEIQKEELTPDLQLLADVCGMECVRLLLRTLPSSSFYLPKITRFEKFIARYVEQHQDKTERMLALELGVCEPFIKKITRSAKKGKIKMFK